MAYLYRVNFPANRLCSGSKQTIVKKITTAASQNSGK